MILGSVSLESDQIRSMEPRDDRNATLSPTGAIQKHPRAKPTP